MFWELLKKTFEEIGMYLSDLDPVWKFLIFLSIVIGAMFFFGN